MSDEIWMRAEIESPCVKVCVIHPEARICAGCYRTIEEIGAGPGSGPRSGGGSWRNCRSGRAPARAARRAGGAARALKSPCAAPPEASGGAHSKGLKE
jgi:uncharacterized protein